MKSKQINKLGKKYFLCPLLRTCVFNLLFCLENQCKSYIRNNLRAPSIPLVKKWGRKLGLSVEEVASVNDRLLIRQQLGNLYCILRIIM